MKKFFTFTEKIFFFFLVFFLATAYWPHEPSTCVSSQYGCAPRFGEFIFLPVLVGVLAWGVFRTMSLVVHRKKDTSSTEKQARLVEIGLSIIAVVGLTILGREILSSLIISYLQ